MGQEIGLHRTYLYASGTKPNAMVRALESGADAVILDLEDSVAPEDKDAARTAVAAFISEHGALAGCDVHVRVNRTVNGFDADDVRAAVQPGVTALRLPKVEHPDNVRIVDALVTDLEASAGVRSGSIGLYPTVETALGAVALEEVLRASNRTRRPAFGQSDFLADISADGDSELATLHVRAQIAMVSRAVGCGMPIDSVYPHIDDEDGLIGGALRAKAMGFFGKSVIHARQVDPINRVFTPDAAAVNWAQQIVELLGDAEVHRSGGLVIDGKVIDPGTMQRARAIVELSLRLR